MLAPLPLYALLPFVAMLLAVALLPLAWPHWWEPNRNKLLVSAVLGLVYTRRAGSSLTEYFLSGRALPWWLAGTSMVATTFSADTPLVVAGLVAKYGVAGA